MFPESPQLHHPLSHSHGGHPHYQLQQLSPGDFRPRASSNASSIGRLSPIPAVSESEVQDHSPWSPQDYPSSADVYGQSSAGSGNASDRFNPDQLVDNIAESMKIRENGFLAPSSNSTSSSSSVATVSVNNQQRQSPSATPSTVTNNGYGLCHPPNYGSPYSNQQPPQQQDYHPVLVGASSSSSSVSSSTGRTPSSMGRSPQQPSAPPPSYSMATLQVFSYLPLISYYVNSNHSFFRVCLRPIRIYIHYPLRCCSLWINTNNIITAVTSAD